MSIRHLDHLFLPRSVAVIGASERQGSVGATVWANLRSGGFAGPCWPVNPKHRQLQGQPCYASVRHLPEAPDLAVICTPASTVPGLVRELGARGTRAAIVLSAGFDAAARQAVLDAARPHLLRILGPNCLGLLAPHVGLNASFAPGQAKAGSLAFLSQSGALATAMLDWAAGRQIGFSQVVSLGEHADVDFGDLLDWLGSDARTRAILMYVESVDDARKFMSAARAAARNKPVLVVKAGRSTRGQAAAASHTGALASSDRVFDAAIRRAGMLRVDTVQDLFVAAELLARGARAPDPAPEVPLERVTIVTNGGGAGVMAADAAAQAGLELATLPAATLQALDAALPAHWSHGNPVDLIGDAPVARYVQALQALLATPQTGTVVFLHAPTAIVPSPDIARALVPVLKASPQRVISSWLGGPSVREARELFTTQGLPHFETPEDALRAVSLLATYAGNQAQLTQAPPAQAGAPAADSARVRRLIDEALSRGQDWLDEAQAKALLEACGIPVAPTRVVAAQPQPAAQAAGEVGFPVALKIVSPQITHKSDVGGVALDLEDEAAVSQSAQAMLKRVAERAPGAVLQGFTVQAMVRRPQALELLVGTTIDPTFGPIVLFGQGGTAVEVLADRAVGLPPLNVPLARALVERTRVSRLMRGWRHVPPVREEAVLSVLLALSQLLADEPRIVELDINPLLADAQGVIALDARVRISAAGPGGAARFAIRPYPAELVESMPWKGQTLTLRPIRPEDEARHLAFLAHLDPADIRMRVFHTRRSIERTELARLVQIDYEREMAFVATAPGADGQEETLGVARALCDPDNQDAEFGIVVRSDRKGSGLGRLLMNKLVRHLRARGTRRLTATVLKDNLRMLELAREMGFSVGDATDDPTVWSLAMPLQPEPAPAAPAGGAASD